MREFLSRTLEKKVEQIEFLRSELDIQNTLEKVKTVDVFALVDQEYTHIEINTSYHSHLHIRNFIYFTTLFAKKTTRGSDYDTSAKFLHIDFTYGMHNEKVKQEYGILSLDGKFSYLPNFKIIEFNMDRIMEFWYSEDKKNISKYKHLIMLDLKKKDLSAIAKGDPFMTIFSDKLNHLNDDEYFQSFMTIEEDREYTYNTEKRLAREEGLVEGHAEGLAEGLEKGKKEVAQKLLNRMDMDSIVEITGLSREEIEVLK